MQSRSIAREISLLLLTQITEGQVVKSDSFSIEKLLNQALDTLMQHWRDELDNIAINIEFAQQELLDSELKEFDISSIQSVRKHLNTCLDRSQDILNSLSESVELPRLLSLSDQKEVRDFAIKRVTTINKEKQKIDYDLNAVMEGWRLKRLPRIDRDILRLAYVDLSHFKTPVSVACNEAVNLANRYSDTQGRKMINGVLRRLQNSSLIKIE